MSTSILQTYNPTPNASAYESIPDSTYRVKLTFRVDFTNGGHIYGEDFLLDIPDATVSYQRAAEMIVSAMNLLRAGPVTLFSLQVVRRGEHQDSSKEDYVE
jgi:hypothetical protein